METSWVLFFIDLSKAFDTVSHSCLLNKLPSYGINNKELHSFTDYLFSRTQSVRFKGVLSDANPIFSGVPQGSILGPLLFTIHFNDVHTPLQLTLIITYADDTVISRLLKIWNPFKGISVKIVTTCLLGSVIMSLSLI